MAYLWPPRKLSDNFTATTERIEFYLMDSGPRIRVRLTKDRLRVCHVRMLECKFPDAISGQRVDIFVNQCQGIDPAASHYAGGSDPDTPSGGDEFVEPRRLVSHQFAAPLVVVMMS